jgi:AAA domain, putative AbiEii toxin, Type IV TA system
VWRGDKKILDRPDEEDKVDADRLIIGLLWVLLEGESLLLLEEPELSLNAGIVGHLAPLIRKMQRVRRRQVLVSTHSDALLNEPGIDGREILVLTPATEGTRIEVASDIADVKALLEAGFTVGEAVLPKTKPNNTNRLLSING